MGRVRDAVKTLLGRSEAQIELARMRADFADLMLEVSNAMEKLKMAAVKYAKRDARAMGEALEEHLPSPPEPNNKWTARAAVLARKRERVGTQPPRAPTGPPTTEIADVG